MRSPIGGHCGWPYCTCRSCSTVERALDSARNVELRSRFGI